jgi:poly(A) polymerase
MAISKQIAPYIFQIVSKLQEAGYETYLVGGAVRDLLIKREPKDYDISTAATPEQVQSVFGRRRSRIIGRRFKIVHLYQGREIIEISTFRAAPEPRKQNNSNSLLVLRDNEYGTSYDDAYRRDFTVNAIFYDPTISSMIDYTKQGLKDLATGSIRVIGDPYTRFSEDPVRMLRALKLVGQYNFTLTKETEEALYALMPQIALCSKSRLCLELEKILRKSYSDKILQAFQKHSFLQYFLPNLAKDWKTKSAQASIQLLACHCKRLEQEKCQDYLSVVLALISIPFVNKYLTKDETNCLWKYYPQLEKDIKKIIYYIFSPYSFPKFIMSAVTEAIILQQRFYKKDRPRKTRQHPHFRIAREIAIDLNEHFWKKPDLMSYWKSIRGGEKHHH